MTPDEELAFFLGSLAQIKQRLGVRPDETLVQAVDRVVEERDELRDALRLREERGATS